VNVRIIRHNFVGDKAKIRRRAVALQGFLTQSPAKFDEKTCMNPYVDRFSIITVAAKYEAAALMIDFFALLCAYSRKSPQLWGITRRPKTGFLTS